MNTLNYSDARRILVRCANTEGDVLNATKQAVQFIEACWENDPYWWQYAGNPDLVEALDRQSADVFLGWK